jgi:hypothetical protein
MKNKGYTIPLVDGSFLRVEETTERQEIVLSLHVANEKFKRVDSLSVRLNASQWEALQQTRYDLVCHRREKLEVPGVPAVPAEEEG